MFFDMYMLEFDLPIKYVIKRFKYLLFKSYYKAVIKVNNFVWWLFRLHGANAMKNNTVTRFKFLCFREKRFKVKIFVLFSLNVLYFIWGGGVSKLFQVNICYVLDRSIDPKRKIMTVGFWWWIKHQPENGKNL